MFWINCHKHSRKLKKTMQYPAHERPTPCACQRKVRVCSCACHHAKPCQPQTERLQSEEPPRVTMVVWLCSGLCRKLCPAFPPGIGIMVLVEAGSPGKSSPAGLRSRTDSCPLALMEFSFQSCDPPLDSGIQWLHLETAS